MRLLLVNTNRAREPFPVPPLGLAWVAAAAYRAGHEVKLADLALPGLWRGPLARAIDDFQPEVIGLAVRNIDTALREHYFSYLPEVREIARAAAMSGATLVVGGPGFSIFPRLLLGSLRADYGIVGEGEEALPHLLGRLARGRDPSDVPGLVYRAVGTTLINPPLRCPDLDALPPPAHGLVNYAAYEAEGGWAAVQTKRGCPMSCIYCNYPRLEGSRVRPRGPEAVADELARLERRGVRYVFFADAAFNLPPAHAEAVCEQLLRAGTRLRWMAYLNPRGLNLEQARLFARAGCIGAELGIDSASEAMLATLSKGFGQAEVVAASEAVRGAGIAQALYCLAGGPGECAETIGESLQVISRRTRAELVAVNVGLRIFPGTRLAEIAGLSESDGFAPRFYVSPGLDGPAMRRLFDFCHRHARFATPRDLGHPVTGALTRLMLRLGVRPYWRHAWLNGWQRRLTWWMNS